MSQPILIFAHRKLSSFKSFASAVSLEGETRWHVLLTKIFIDHCQSTKKATYDGDRMHCVTDNLILLTPNGRVNLGVEKGETDIHVHGSLL